MTVRVGLVGLGMMGTTHFKGYQDIPEAQLAALCDIQPQRVEGDFSGTAGNIDTGSAARADVAGMTGYTSFDELLADPDIDMVDLCLPTYLHEPMTIQALQAGKHVFCEKPMALNYQAAQNMIQAAQDAGKQLMIGQCLRFWPEYVMIKEMIDAGTYGKPLSVLLRRIGGTPGWAWDNWLLDAARSGGAALDLHIHDVDTANWFLGAPQTVYAGGTRWDDGGVAHVFSQYTYPDGPAVCIEGAWDGHGAFPFSMSIQIVFDSATVDYSSANSPSLSIYLPDGTVETPTPPAGDAYTEELRYFVGCLNAGEEPTRVPNVSAAQAVALVQAELESVKTGQPVAVTL